MRKPNHRFRLGLKRRNNRIPARKLRQSDSVAREHAAVHIHRRVTKQRQVLLHQVGQECPNTRHWHRKGSHHFLLQNSQEEDTLCQQTLQKDCGGGLE